jgi:hypothetical protein
MIRQSKRRYTKRLILANCGLAWIAIFVSIYFHESQWIAVSAFGLIASIVAYYMNVGHKDLVRLLESTTVPVDKQMEITDAVNDSSPSEN